MQQFNETSKFGLDVYHLYKCSWSLRLLESFQQVQVGCWFNRKKLKTMKFVCQPSIKHLLEKLYSLLFFRVEAMIST